MKMRTSFGDFISTLYDTVDTDGSSQSGASQVVTACTLDLLLRQRNGRLIAALFDPSDSDLN